MYVISGFQEQTHLNGEFFQRLENINSDWSYVEIGKYFTQSATILARGHNGLWWFDDDLSDFEHDALSPDGVWAWTAYEGNIFESEGEILANEWNGAAWTPVTIHVAKHCDPCTYHVSGFDHQDHLNGTQIIVIVIKMIVSPAQHCKLSYRKSKTRIATHLMRINYSV